jgi:hypothetical protein
VARRGPTKVGSEEAASPGREGPRELIEMMTMLMHVDLERGHGT